MVKVTLISKSETFDLDCLINQEIENELPNKNSKLLMFVFLKPQLLQIFLSKLKDSTHMTILKLGFQSVVYIIVAIRVLLKNKISSK